MTLENNAISTLNNNGNNYLSSNLPQLEQFLEDSQILLYGSSDTINGIITRGTHEKMGELKILNQEQLVEIAKNNEEIDRATTALGRSQSSYMNYLMTVSGFTPIRNLHQLLCEIESRRSALRENIFKQKKQVIELKQKEEKFNKLLKEYKDIEDYLSTLDESEYTITLGEVVTKEKRKKVMLKETFDELKYEIPKLRVEIEEAQANLADSRLYVEGALKTMLQHQKAYNAIQKHHNLENWDELDYEKEEARYHVTTAFAQALEDVCSRGGTIDKGDLIYMRQIGIHPLVATMELQKHMNKVTELINGDVKFGLTNDHCEMMIDFLNEMADKYADSCQKLLKNKGLVDGYIDPSSAFQDRNQDLLENSDK